MSFGEPAIDRSDNLYRCEFVASSLVGTNEAIVTFGRGSPSFRVPRAFANALDGLASFLPLSEHVRRITNALGDDEAHKLVSEIVNGLAAHGLVLSRANVLGACARHSRPEKPDGANLRSIAFVTRDRLASLDRIVSSFVENTRVHATPCDFMIANDSPSPSVRDSYRALLGELARKHDVKVSFAGLEEKERFARLLSAEADVDIELVRFALLDTHGCGCSIGANRNALLLHHAGEPFLSADDDVEACLTVPPAVGPEELAFSEYNMDTWFFSDRRAVLDAIETRSESIVRLHERFLGKSFGSIVRATSRLDAIDVEAMTPFMMRDLLEDSGRVTLTLTGIFGDCAIDGPETLLFMSRSARHRLLGSRTDYERGMTSREIVRVAPRPTISHVFPGAGMSTSLAFDGRTLLPPFFPVMRQEDSLFALVLQRCMPNAYAAFVPRAIYHAAEHRGTYASGLRAADLPMANLLAVYVGSTRASPSSEDPADRMGELGERLIELGSLTSREFCDLTRNGCAAFKQRGANHLRARVGEVNDAPSYWVDDVRRFLDQLESTVQAPDFGAPSDLLAGRTPNEALQLAQQLVRRYGELLTAWPTVMDAARRLRARGIRLGEAAPRRPGG